MQEIDYLLQERFAERSLEIKRALTEINELLNDDNDLLEKFYSIFVITCWGV